MEGKIDLIKEFSHYATEHKSSNPFNETGIKEILTRRYKENVDDSKPLDNEASIQTVTVDFHKKIPQLEDVDLIKSDPLCNMPTLSEKESVRRTRDKYVKLQLLYMHQFRYLLFKYHVNQKKKLENQKSNSESCTSELHPNNLKWTTEEEYAKLQKLKLLEQYHKLPTGQEAVTFKTAMDRKIRASPFLSNKGIVNPRNCTFVEMGIKCKEKIMPKSKFCKKHIIKDSKQVLFRACGILQSGSKCQEPIFNFDEESTCILHEKIPMLRD
ncbi:Potential DNA-binding domain [Cinara cedri]|uniref:KAT8 regulatory NSL complex subunit 2 n=1 Tax=Cinara cedri TaxID=506608 RepID=A0A5E4M6L7_9HEMI|nr:Potential DNA-binding domain [Cinara cedri]